MGQATKIKMADQGSDSAEVKSSAGIEANAQGAEEIAERASEFQKNAEDSVKELSQSVAAYVQEKPLQAAGIAFAAGIVTTLLLSRR